MIPISSESPAKIKLTHALKKIFKIPLFFILLIIKLILLILKLLFLAWNKLFNTVYHNRKYILKVLIRLVIISDIILLSVYLVRYYGFNQQNQSLVDWIHRITFGSLGTILIFYLYYLFDGKQSILKSYVLLTEKYVEEALAAIIKIYGPPRIGKDTTGISIVSILCRRNKRIIPIAMKKIRKICYIFDYQQVNNACNIYYRRFLSSSKKTRKEKFIELCEESHLKAFLKERYLTKIDYHELVDEYREWDANKITFESDYLYNDGISKKHFLELLNEYMFLYVRLYIIKNFSLLNQPYLEDSETGMMGKVYSAYYEAVATPEPKIFNFTLSNGNKIQIVAKEKVESPIIDWTVIELSENDTWDSNMDTKATKFIKEHHKREFKAFYGHGYDMLTYIQICHDSQRMNKQLRELDAFYMNILQRQEFLGAGKRVAILKILQRFTNFFAERGEVKLDDANNTIIYKRQEKIDYYRRLYNASGDDKYLALIENIQSKELKKSSKFTDWMSRKNKKLLEHIEQLQRKNGVIRITATISDQPTAPNLKEATLKQLLNRETPLYHEAYRVDFYFRMTDSMGRYNHKYMSDVLESRAKQSTTTFYDIESWDKSMKLSKEAMLHMGYPAGIDLYDITDKEVYDRWYEPVNKPVK